MNVMRENQKNMRAWFYACHPRRAHAQHAPGSLCRTRKETLFPDIFESGKLRFLNNAKIFLAATANFLNFLGKT